MDVYSQALKVLATCRSQTGQDQDGKSRKSGGHSDGLQHSTSLARSGSAGAGVASLLPPLPQSPASQQRRQRHSQQHKARKGQSGATHGAAQGSDKPAVGRGSALPSAAPLPLTPTQPQPITLSQGLPSTPVYAAPATPARLRGTEGRCTAEPGEAKTPLHSPSSSSSPRQALRRRGSAVDAAGGAAAVQPDEGITSQGVARDTDARMSDVEKLAPTVSEPLTLGGGRESEASQGDPAAGSADRDQALRSEARGSVASGSAPPLAADAAQVKQESGSILPLAAPQEAAAAQSQALQPGEQAGTSLETSGQGTAGASSAASTAQHGTSNAAAESTTPGELVKTGPVIFETEPTTSEAGQGAEPLAGRSEQKHAQSQAQPPVASDAPATALVQPPELVQSPSLNKGQSSRQQGAPTGQSSQGQAQTKGSKDPPPPPPPPVRLGYALRFKLWALVEEMHGSFREDDVTALKALVSPHVGAPQEREPGSAQGTPSSSPVKRDSGGGQVTPTSPHPAVKGGNLEGGSDRPPAQASAAKTGSGPAAPPAAPAAVFSGDGVGAGTKGAAAEAEGASEVQAELDCCNRELAALAPRNQACLGECLANEGENTPQPQLSTTQHNQTVQAVPWPKACGTLVT